MQYFLLETSSLMSWALLPLRSPRSNSWVKSWKIHNTLSIFPEANWDNLWMACSWAKIHMTLPMDGRWQRRREGRKVGKGEKTLAESRGKIRTPHMVSSAASKERAREMSRHLRSAAAVFLLFLLSLLSLYFTVRVLKLYGLSHWP